MKIIKFLPILLLSLGLSAQGSPESGTGSAGIDTTQEGKSISETEKELDDNIFEVNKKLTRHTILFKMKVKTLPHRTVLYKGKPSQDGERCEPGPKQEGAENTCIHIEVFDFQGSEDGRSEYNLGAKFKTLELFFEGANNGDPDPRKEQPRNLTKIRTYVYQNNFVMEDKVISMIIDSGANTQAAHNEKIELFYQHDGDPNWGTPETPSQKGVGKYILSNVENTKTNPIRNNFKKQFYFKNLDYFDKLFTKVFDYNDRDSNKHYKKNVETLKSSLKY
ncbi:flagellar-coiling protein FcpB [Leptospira sp. 'Mane']|uniref:flagellar-coiling protein FcpB n=1 Tax=Leptospira sp. 'Mane' TaxID=3387407 RepID=UPI00398B5B11